MISEDVLLARGAVYKKVKKGDYIFKEDSRCSYYFQLVDGKVIWNNFNEDGKIFIQSIVEPGESFGELPLFDDEPYAANAIADTDSIIIQLLKPTFQKLLQDDFKLHFAFSKLLAQRIRYKFLVLKELACHNPEKQIFNLLSFYRNKHQSDSNKPYKVLFTRQQLAGMTGLRVETVIRVIKKLCKNGKLQINKGKVFLPYNNDDTNHKSFA